MLLFHEVCHFSKIYLLIDGLKSENGILKEVGFSEAYVIGTHWNQGASLMQFQCVPTAVVLSINGEFFAT